MSAQTKQYRWLPWAVATSLVALIVVMIAHYDVLQSHVSLMPWEAAQGVDTIRAINEFSDGSLDLNAYWRARIGALIGIILLFVLGPSLWIFGEIRHERTQESGESLGKGLGWYAGITLVILGLLYALPGTAVKAYVFQDTWENAARSRNADQVRTELMSMSYDLAEHYYVAGGWKGAITLEDLQSYNPNSRNDFVVASRSDSLLKVYGIGFKNGSNPDFENANGQQGKLQLAVEITPEGEIYKFVNENTNKP